ncbi:MAG: hypothetical protein JRE70_10025 [Deltaproteobacteria bacterium]|nr:hypothetical protein [Deltaproteobacteria bacterium]
MLAIQNEPSPWALFIHAFAMGALLLGLLTVPTTSWAAELDADERVPLLGGPAATQVLRAASDRARASVERSREARESLARWQMALVVSTLGLALWSIHDPAPSRRKRRMRRLAYGAAAFAAIASFYGTQLFERSASSLHLKDVYHYWLGTRYFAELGYGELYDCTLAVAEEQDWWWVHALPYARDLRTMQTREARALIQRGVRECKGQFSEARWASFTKDVTWFNEQFGAHQWRRVLNDHGYNPSPIWALAAAPFAAAVSPESLRWLARLDVLLLAGAFTAVGWAFGLELACLTIVIWGTGWLWDARWVGNAFLRQMWFSAALVGLCCLKQRREIAASVLIGYASWLRLFPAIALAGYGLSAVRRWIRAGSLPRDARRFALGFAVSSAVLVAASFASSGIDLETYEGFGRNLVTLRTVPSINLVGLEPLLWRLDGTSEIWRMPTEAIAEQPLDRPSESRVMLWLVGAIAIGAFCLVTRDALPWEASAATFTLLPMLAAPACYYMQIVVLGVVLGARRPWVVIWLLAACLGWLATGVLAPNRNIEYGPPGSIDAARRWHGRLPASGRTR